MVKTLFDELSREELFAGDIFVNEPLQKHTTLRIGGNADLFLLPRNLISLSNLLGILKQERVRSLAIGFGSNLLFSDKGYRGAIISTVLLNRIELIMDEGDATRLFVESGTPLPKVISIAKERGFAGMEGLTGIPGSVGGAVKGNAGSFGFEMKDVVESVSVVDESGALSVFKRDALAFRYRSSGIPDNAVILSADLKLRHDDPLAVAAKTSAFLQEKRQKHPIAERSAGCVFRNPAHASAGRLIDEAGCKGLRQGDIEVSTLHANYFINQGSGTSSDFLRLMEHVRERVIKIFGISLEPEIQIIGEDGND